MLSRKKTSTGRRGKEVRHRNNMWGSLGRDPEQAARARGWDTASFAEGEGEDLDSLAGTSMGVAVGSLGSVLQMAAIFSTT